MLIVALTGGIATGKSVVARLLKSRGCFIFEADKIAHVLMEPDQPAWHKILKHFGPGILNADRTIDRSRLGDIVFGDEAERQALNGLIHPLVLEHQRAIVLALNKEGRARIFVSEAALVYEAGFARHFDKVVVVWCQPRLQLQRLMDRDNIGKEEAWRKIQSQMDLEEKKKMADYLIDTSGTMADTAHLTEVVYKSLSRDYELGGTRRG
jgi:dephospho-CoA kinase